MRRRKERMDRRFELVTSEAVDALTSGSKIGAIKIVRERSGLGLAEAKELVEL
ncbi:MAG: ribosomal protein L7/L12, partial [Bdellovibrionales bacterium]|nr:ribosomal protein L7/L12 [Bdellovibrionales bacterium]